MHRTARVRMTKGQKPRAAKAVTPPHVVMRDTTEAHHKTLVTARGPVRAVIATLRMPSSITHPGTIKTLTDQVSKARIHSEAARSRTMLVAMDHLLSLCRIAAPSTGLEDVIRRILKPLSRPT